MTGQLATLPPLPAARLLAAALVAALLAFVPQLAMPRPVAACSCIAPQPLAQYATDGSVILSGTVIGRDALGVQVAVTQWFSGDRPSPLVRIAGDFGNGASCGVGSEPPAGSSWIWVAWRPEGEDDLSISICTPFADLSTPEGQSLLAEAQQTFAGGGVPSPAPGSPSEPPVESTPPEDAGVTGGTVMIAAVGGVVVLAALVLGATAVVARRRRPADPGGAA
jgi:hypothetical protein